MGDGSSIQQVLLKTTEQLLRPIIRVLLSHGLSHSALTDLCRRVFVEESHGILKAKGQKPTVSAISGITGLSRKEVTRLQSIQSEALAEASTRRNRAVQVLSGWANDSEFTSSGPLRTLPMHGPSCSFSALVKKYSGDVTPVAMLRLLVDSGNVRLNDDTVELLSEAYLPMQTSTEKLEIFGTDGAELLATIEHNMAASAPARRFQRKVSTTRLDPSVLPRFKAMNEQKAMELLEEYDAWFSQHELKDDSTDAPVYIAAGIYVYEEQSEDKPS